MKVPAALRNALALGLAIVLMASSDCEAPGPAVPVDAGGHPAFDCTPGSANAEDPASLEAGSPSPRGFGYPDDPEPLPERVAYLTFDDGPSEWTPVILEILQHEHILATFFITSRQLKGRDGLRTTFTDAQGEPRSFQQVLAATLAQGHSIGNHTVDHLNLALLDDATAACQLDANERAINDALAEQGLVPRPLTLLRPPFGSPWYSQRSVSDPVAEQARIGALLARRGVNVLWTVDSTDAREWAQGESFSSTEDPVPAPTAEAPSFDDKVARIVTSVLQDRRIARGEGAIVILHDTHSATRDALPALIAGLRASGYTFGSIEALVAARWHATSAELYSRSALHD